MTWLNAAVVGVVSCSVRSFLHMPRRILEALMLAAGAIFGLKGEGDHHWSDSPIVESIVVSEEAGPDGPPAP